MRAVPPGVVTVTGTAPVPAGVTAMMVASSRTAKLAAERRPKRTHR
ncbi:hypothetical protein [Streptomyces botrytidirepellens]|nr:hypothetical protein [Streptomyces botrytidirepellens]